MRLIRVAAFTAAFFALAATPALGYQESIDSTNPAGTPAFSCPTCHGLEAESTTVTPAPGVPSTWTLEATATVGTRKGPHGGYTAGTQKCVVCHTTHGSSTTSIKNLNDSGIPAGTWTSTEILRFEETIAATCFTCHDGTGGGGVYGVIKQRTGNDPAEFRAGASMETSGGIHRIGWTNAAGKAVVPGGNSDPAVAMLEVDLSGKDGSLTCTDCHSPHNSNTVEPFKGDRIRSADDTTSGYATNRLLKRKPTLGAVAVDQYGSDWCRSCHKSNHKPGAPGLVHKLQDRSVENPNPWNYGRVAKLTDYNNDYDWTIGSLGGDNFGYFMILDPSDRPYPSMTDQPYPICQQCHEDSRAIGGGTLGVDGHMLLTGQGFDPALDGNSAGNPTYQNFPHETLNDRLLIETTDGLCMNCHSVLP